MNTRYSISDSILKTLEYIRYSIQHVFKSNLYCLILETCSLPTPRVFFCFYFNSAFTSYKIQYLGKDELKYYTYIHTKGFVDVCLV